MQRITVESTISAPLETVWQAYTSPGDIVQWNAASDDWHCPRAEVDLREGGAFCFRMEARDHGHGFDFEGVYTRIEPMRCLEYRFGERQARVDFETTDWGVRVRVAFDPETEFPLELQRAGWQAILDRFSRYVSALRAG